MCGIAGWADARRDIADQGEVMKKMGDAIAHRGPDARGDYFSRRCALAHTRLAVIDPENGAQPMRYGAYTIVYNGELYNTDELRSDLLRAGEEFSTRSDTEVLLRAYVRWGKDCLSRLNGIYAFAIWDSDEETLFLARDRVGVKPLFYYAYEGGLIFASEIKSLLAHPYIKPVLDEEGAASLLMLGPARKGGTGVFRDIRELLPGEYAIFKDGRLKRRIYWSLVARPHTETLPETMDHLRFLLVDSIERQLVSDVPLCTFLSGGLDSSLISAIAARKYAREGRRLDTYSVDYKDNRKNFVASAFQPDEDAPWIVKMSEFIGSAHTNVVIDSPALADALVPSMRARDLPGMADVDSSLYLFCGEVKKRFTVAVSGECADEIFMGYPWYHKPELLNAEGFPWARSTAQRAGLLRRELSEKIDPAGYVREAAARTADRASSLDEDSDLDRATRRMFMLNFYWFMQTLLDRKDRCSMAHGLEVRVPFCDHRIAEYAYNIPREMKTFGGREKGLVRKIAEEFLPYDVVWRKKSPYPKTHNPTYSRLVFERFCALRREKDFRLTALLDPDKLDELIETEGKSFSENWYGQLMCTPQMFAYLIQLELWLREYEPEIRL
ncbi:MAG: asparagine synthase (glutamine-hydrolyzing) [Bacteroides sp.]|nr:asparagine synthase (glutamine-hydrolyzing) [Eubacterium sp.]MCM1418241.1 asparagine synthase (glutamine-hydrolyzing) [Roseburia sp.]MCM1462377.1 asparagine synthase (glutamine-hydrolyzing) [Bacteroides sp.]